MVLTSLCGGTFSCPQPSLFQARVSSETALILIDQLKSPDQELVRAASAGLQRLAKLSPAVRIDIIRRLIRILDTPEGPGEDFSRSPITYLLGDLRAVQAIEVLIKRLTEPGFGTLSHPSPSVDALIKIAQPAVSRLIEVLRQEDPVRRRYAAFALGRIGGSHAESALRQALLSETDPEARWEIELSLTLSRKKRWPQKNLLQK